MSQRPPKLSPPSTTALPLWLATPETLDDVIAGLPEGAETWVRSNGYKANAGASVVLSGPDGTIAGAILGMGSEATANRRRFTVAKARDALPDADWRIETPLDHDDASEAALAWLLSGYRFDRYKSSKPSKARLVAPQNVDAERQEKIATGEFLTRDLINTPAEDMGPQELEEACRALATEHGASIDVIAGDALLEQNFPLIHTVGRAAAADRAPRLIDMSWGRSGPRLTLVGKGVCFDTGGLNLKPGGSMSLMKKDMGGSATVLGLASMIMALGLEIQLRVLIPAVENSVSGCAFRPGDVLTARNGKTVEINNTDAEGRLVLADALALAAEGDPGLLVSMATLTGAARVAVGPDLAPFYTDDEELAAALSKSGAKVRDPVWRMPFWSPYETMIEPAIADLDNAPGGGQAGSITAALFLRRFAGAERYLHFDIYGWQPSAAPGRPKGGVGQGARALLDALPGVLS